MTQPRSLKTTLLATIGLLIPVVLAHGQSVRYGLFMDDWAHYRQLQEAGWSLQSLTEACRLELVGGITEYWWMPECTLRFFRPVSFGLMKLTYTLTGWSPMAAHVASIGWHLLVCVLLYQLLKRLGATAGVAWVVSALFAIHPGHVTTVQWIACQTELMVTAFLLVAALCVARFRGWPDAGGMSEGTRIGDWRWGVGALLAYGLALGCRENAIMFPLVMMAAEPLVTSRSRRTAIVFYGILAVVSVIYLGIRAVLLDGVALPPPPYIYPPTEPGFVRFIFDKMCYYLIGEYLFMPVIPIGGVPYFRTVPVAFYGMAILVGLVMLYILWRHARKPGGLLGIAWVVLFAFPLLPAFASPHHLYLPGIGWAVSAMCLLRGLLGDIQPGRWLDRLRLHATRTAVAGLAAILFALTYYSSLTIDTAQQVEDYLTQEVTEASSGIADGDTIYIANLPLIAHYLKLGVERDEGVRDIRVVPLTWSPRVLGFLKTESIPELIWRDARTLDLRIVGDDKYFSGVLRRLVTESNGDRPILTDRAPFQFRDDFSVELLDPAADGVQSLRFTFNEPLAAPGRHLFWGSRERWAYEIQRVPDDE